MENEEDKNEVISDDYRKAVESYARDCKDYQFHNKGSEHARIILPLIFKNAEKEIRIAAQNLWNSELVNTDEYIKAANEYLNKPNTIFHIIVTNFPKDEVEKSAQINSFYKMVYQHPAYSENRVIIKESSGKSFKQNGQPVNFCTADGRMYRLEFDIDKRMALCNFNDPSEVDKMNSIFDEAWEGPDVSVVDLKPCFNNVRQIV